MKCSDYAIVPITKVIRAIFTMIEVIAPILAIVAGTILLLRMMTNPDDKKLINNMKNMILSLVIVFLLPALTNLTMYILGENFSVSSCWNNAYKINTSGNGGYIEKEGKNKIKIIEEKTYDKGTTEKQTTDYSYANGEKNAAGFLNSLQRMSDFVKKDRKNRWYYLWGNPSSTFVKADKSNNTHLTCVLLSNWGLRELGILKESQLIYQNPSNYELRFSNGAKSAAEKYGKFYHFNDKPTLAEVEKRIGLKPGDIIYWAVDHTNVYAGKNKKGKDTFYESGHGGDGHYAGGKFYFDSFGPVARDNRSRRVRDLYRLNS